MKLAPLWLLALAVASCQCNRERPSAFGDPLYVNGKRIEDDEIKLALIYGRGRLQLDLRTSDLIVENEVATQIEEAAEAEVATREKTVPFPDLSARKDAKKLALKSCAARLRDKYRISDAEFETEYKHNLDDFKRDYPTLDLETEIARAFRSVDWYRASLRRAMEFDRVFLPPNPDEWPSSTIEAFRADPNGGELLIPDAKQSYEARIKAAEQHNGQMPREDPLYVTFQRDIVRDAKLGALTIKKHSDGIPKGLALWVDTNGDGKPELELTIEELWREVQKTISATDVSETKQWFVTARATRDRLEKDGALLEREKARAAVEQYARESDVPSIERQARDCYFFPSGEAFTEYLALREGYRRRIAPVFESSTPGELSPALQAYLGRANRVRGLGMVDAEVLLVSALDAAKFHWKDDGWNWAKRKAQALRTEYDHDPTPECWSRLMNEHSEYWDPPPVAGKQHPSAVGYKQHGRFGNRYRNDLISYVGESTYTEWVTGECITDRIFFDQLENTVAGPFRGPLGWYLTRVKTRTPPVRPLNLTDERQLRLLKDDYLRWSFIQYSKEAVAKAEIRGWKPL